ncbi:MaoC family dehydratase [Clostridium tyrobutyricum]|nr:MaoC family dehydratase [Clostridium tyrobutyricum]
MIKSFSKLSGDENPIHLNEEYAKTTIFKRRIAPGMLISSFISAVIANKLPGRGSVYLKQDLKFRRPVYINDVITTKVEIIGINIEKNIIILSTNCINQSNVIVIEGNAFVKV